VPLLRVELESYILSWQGVGVCVAVWSELVFLWFQVAFLLVLFLDQQGWRGAGFPFRCATVLLSVVLARFCWCAFWFYFCWPVVLVFGGLFFVCCFIRICFGGEAGVYV